MGAEGPDLTVLACGQQRGRVDRIPPHPPPISVAQVPISVDPASISVDPGPISVALALAPDVALAPTSTDLVPFNPLDEEHLMRIFNTLPTSTAIGSQMTNNGPRVTIQTLMGMGTDPGERAYWAFALINAIRDAKDAFYKSVTIIHKEIIQAENNFEQVGGLMKYHAMVALKYT